MKFNGIDLADRYTSSAGGYFIVNDVRGRGVLGSEVDMIDVPGRDGSYVIGKRRPPRALEVDITLKGDSYEDLRKKIEDLNALLTTDGDAEIVFDDEPDRVYYGRLAEVNDKLEKSKIYQATLTFICPDPYKYGPFRTQTINVPPASFSRNSVAYLSDGTQVAANQPRFEQGGVLIEEGTVNLVPYSEELDKWPMSGGIIVAANAIAAPNGTITAEKLTSAVGSSSHVNTTLTVSAGSLYTISAYVKKDTTDRFKILAYDTVSSANIAGGHWSVDSNGNITSANVQIGTATIGYQSVGNGWWRIWMTITAPSSGLRIYMYVDEWSNTWSAGKSGYVWGVQVEQKAYPTTYMQTSGTTTTRQPETLTLPTDGILFMNEGTIECRFYYKPNGTYQRIISFIGPAAFNGYKDLQFDITSTGYVRFQPYRTDGTETAISVFSKNPISEGWHFACCSWNQNEIKIAVDNQPIVRRTYGGGIAALDSFFTIAKEHKMNSNFLNSIISELRISRIARSDAEILDAYQNGFTVDEHTTAHLDFENSLEVQTPTIVTNEGTAETYPTFTAYVKQPITFLDIIAPDAYMRVGQPYEVSQTPVDGDKPVMKDEMGTLTGWGAASAVDGGVVQGEFQSDGNRFIVKNFGPTYNGWAGPALKKSLPYQIQDFRVHALIDIVSSANGVGRIEIYGLDSANNFVFRMAIGDFSAKAKNVKAFWELGPSTDTIFVTYGKKTGSLNDYYGSLVIERRGNRWYFCTAKRTSQLGVYTDFVEKTFVDTKNQYSTPLAQIQVHIGTHLGYGPIDHMSINHVYVYDLHNPATDQIPYIAYPDDILQFDHKNAVIYRNGEPIMSQKDFGARFFPLAPGATELAVNPSDAATVEVEYRPRYK